MRLVRAFGKAVFDVIEADPSRLLEVEGIGPVRAKGIAAGWAAQKVVRKILLFLHTHGVGTSRAVRIYKTHDAEAVAIITEKAIAMAVRNGERRRRWSKLGEWLASGHA